MGEKAEIIKRQRPKIKKHKATMYMLLGGASDYLDSYTSTDKIMIIKTNMEFTGRQWAKLMFACQREIDKMTGDRLVRKY